MKDEKERQTERERETFSKSSSSISYSRVASGGTPNSTLPFLPYPYLGRNTNRDFSPFSILRIASSIPRIMDTSSPTRKFKAVAHKHTHTHIYIYTHTHTHTHIRTRTYICSRRQIPDITRTPI